MPISGHEGIKAAGMPDWVSALKKVNPSEAQKLDFSRNDAFAAVVDLGLPHYSRFNTRLDDFFSNPKKNLKNIKTRLCYVNLKPLHNSFQAFRQPGLATESLEEFLSKLILEKDREFYELTVSEYKVNQFGGNVIINNDGTIEIEFKRGTQGPISDGTENPEFYVKMNASGVMHYSFEDINLRKNIWNTVRKIPHEGNKYLPGYYEFQLVSKSEEDSPSLEPIFVDYRQAGAYLTKESI